MSASSICGSRSTQRMAPRSDRRYGRLVVIDPSGAIGLVGRAVFFVATVAALAVGMLVVLRTCVSAWRYRADTKNSACTPTSAGSASVTRSLCGSSQSGCTTSAAKIPRRVSIRAWASPSSFPRACISSLSRFPFVVVRVATPMLWRDRQKVWAGMRAAVASSVSRLRRRRPHRGPFR